MIEALIEEVGMKKKMIDKPVEDLISDLKSQAVFVRKTAIMQLEKKMALVAVPALVELMSDPEATIRGCTAWALGEIKDSRAQAGLEHSLMDMDSSVRRAAAQALGKLADASVVESLRKLSIDADRYVREAAADAILRIQERHGKAAPVEPGRNMAGKALVS